MEKKRQVVSKDESPERADRAYIYRFPPAQPLVCASYPTQSPGYWTRSLGRSTDSFIAALSRQSGLVFGLAHRGSTRLGTNEAEARQLPRSKGRYVNERADVG